MDWLPCADTYSLQHEKGGNALWMAGPWNWCKKFGWPEFCFNTRLERDLCMAFPGLQAVFSLLFTITSDGTILRAHQQLHAIIHQSNWCRWTACEEENKRQKKQWKRFHVSFSDNNLVVHFLPTVVQIPSLCMRIRQRYSCQPWKQPYLWKGLYTRTTTFRPHSAASAIDVDCGSLPN